MKDLEALRERAKELRCLYAVDGVLSEPGLPTEQALERVLDALPGGWQRPGTTGARIVLLGRSYVGRGYSAAARTQAESLRLWGTDVGRVEVSDSSEDAEFLAEETELLRNVARRVGEFLERRHAELLGARAASVGNHWRWRESYAEALARSLDQERFGSCRVFLTGSTERGEAGPESDIDLTLVSSGSEAQRAALSAWIDGWSACLAELAYQQTGHRFAAGVLDVTWSADAPVRTHALDVRELVVGPVRRG